MHVKIDLSTGEKWAKIAVGDEDDTSTSVQLKDDEKIEKV
jgi:hypothetical protein